MKVITYIPVIEDGKEANRPPNQGEHIDLGHHNFIEHEVPVDDMGVCYPIYRRVELELPEGLEGHTPGPWEMRFNEAFPGGEGYATGNRGFIGFFKDINKPNFTFIEKSVNFLSAILKAGEGK